MERGVITILPSIRSVRGSARQVIIGGESLDRSQRRFITRAAGDE